VAQPVYPVTLPLPDVEGFSRQPAFEPVLRSPYEDGNELVMRTHTFVPLVWSFQYRDMSTTDRDALMAFWEGPANCGAVVVKFTDPTNSTAYFVRFASMPECSLETSQQQRWRVMVRLKQAPGSYT